LLAQQPDFVKSINIFKAVDGSVPNLNTSLLEKYGLQQRNSKLLKGQIGCFLSHYSLWDDLSNETESCEAYLVLEDDANVVHPHFWRHMNNLLQEVNTFDKDWKWIYLFVYPDQYATQGGKEGKFNIEGLSFIENACKTYGTGAYIVSKQGAKLLTQKVREKGIERPVDDLIMRDILVTEKGFYAATGNCLIDIDGQLYKTDTSNKMRSNIW
jgi:GR25 family glycosyltransferase involved in LPS biosynthesis